MSDKESTVEIAGTGDLEITNYSVKEHRKNIPVCISACAGGFCGGVIAFIIVIIILIYID